MSTQENWLLSKSSNWNRVSYLNYQCVSTNVSPPLHVQLIKSQETVMCGDCMILHGEGLGEWNFKDTAFKPALLVPLASVSHAGQGSRTTCAPPSAAGTQAAFSQLRMCVSPAGEDFAVVQQEIIMMKDCKHSNIVAYFGSYLR